MMKLLNERWMRLDAGLLRFRWRMFWLAWLRFWLKPATKARWLWLKVRHRGRDARRFWRFDVYWPLRLWWVTRRHSLKFHGVNALLFGFLAFVAYGALFGTPPQKVPGEMKASTSPLWSLVPYAWTGFLFFSLLLPVWHGSARGHWRFFRRIRPGIVLQNVGVMFGVVACSVALKHFFPFLDRSWLYLLPLGSGPGGGAGNIAVMPTQLPFVGLPFLVLLVLNLPDLAHWEEEHFREGTLNWSDAAKRSLIFGPIHCLMGVPLYAGLALTLGGMWFSFQYFRGGVERSTLHHLTYNLIAMLILALLMLR